MTSKPRSASAGSCSWTPANPPNERGNSSYQAPTRARSRSTSTSYCAPRTFSGRVATRRMALATAGARAASARSVPGRSGAPTRSAASATTARSGPRTAPSASRSNAAPSASSLPRSAWPPATLRSSSVRQEAKTSTQASTWKACSPSAVVGNSARQRSIDTGCISTSEKPRAHGGRWRTTARSCSCPSRTRSHSTVTESPALLFTGHRPPSTVGRVSWIWIRGGGVRGVMASTGSTERSLSR